MRTSLVLPCLLLLGLALAHGQGGGGARAREIDIEGRYNCLGENNGGKTYRGITTIAKKNDNYLVTWTIGKESHEGTGIRKGDVLAVSWRDDAGNAGIVVYVIRARGKLEGTWSPQGSTQQYSENLTMDD